MGLEHVETFGKEPHVGRVTEKVLFPSNSPPSVVLSSQKTPQASRTDDGQSQACLRDLRIRVPTTLTSSAWTGA